MFKNELTEKEEAKINKRRLINGIIVLSFLIALTGCTTDHSDDIQADIFDHFEKGMNKDEVINDLGEPDEIVNDDDLLYNDIELCEMFGSLTVQIKDSSPVFILWEYDTEGRAADECEPEMQVIYNHFVDKFGSAEIREYSTRSNIYIWHRDENSGPSGSPQYVLDFDDVNSTIRVYVNFEV